MKTSTRIILAAAALSAAACGDLATSNKSNVAANTTLAAAFTTVPVGFTNTENSFAASAEPLGGGWFPRALMGGMGHPEGPMIGGGLGPMIGGGLSDDFIGGLGLGLLFGHGRFGDPDLDDASCAFVAATGRITCTAVTRGGLTINRSVAFTNAAGVAQSSFDSLTNTINTQIAVAGTITRRDSATTTVSDASNRTVGGLAKGSTQHTIDGTASATETTNGTDSTGAFVAMRSAADTTSGIIIPLSSTTFTYPTAGTIIRTMTVSLAYSGKAALTSSHREVITYNGTKTAQLVITQDGTTRTCTLPLPFGRPTCQ